MFGRKKIKELEERVGELEKKAKDSGVANTETLKIMWREISRNNCERGKHKMGVPYYSTATERWIMSCENKACGYVVRMVEEKK